MVVLYVNSKSYSAVGDGIKGCLCSEWVWYEVGGHCGSQRSFFASCPIALTELPTKAF